MTPGIDLIFLEQKLRVLQATDEFEFQLNKAYRQFDYEAALKNLRTKAIGMKCFHDRSVNLIRWIYIHKAYQMVLKQHESSGYRKQLGERSTCLSSAFSELQLSALTLLRLLNDSLETLQKDGLENTLGSNAYDSGYEHRLGIDILQTIINSKPEKYWVDMYEQGFKDSRLNCLIALK